MDINLAKTFLAVADSGSFVGAANILHVTQSTISARVKELELILSRQLFVRSKAGARLTAAGVRFKDHAATLVRVWNQAQQEIALSNQFSGLINIGAQLSLWEHFVLDWVEQMREAAPEIAINAKVRNADELMKSLAEGDLDLIVLYTPRSRPGLHIEKLFDEHLVLVSDRPDDAALDPQRYVYVDWGTQFKLFHSAQYPDFTTPALRMSVGTMGLQYILNKGGMGYFPVRMVSEYLVQQKLYRVQPDAGFSRTIYVGTQTEAKNPAVDTGLSFLKQLAARPSMVGLSAGLGVPIS